MIRGLLSSETSIAAAVVAAALSLSLLLTLNVSATAQQGSPAATPSPTPDEGEIEPEDVISVETAEVLLPVTVRHQNGQIVTDLTQKDFKIFEDGVEQPLSDLSLRQAPVDVVLMVDASSSVANNLDDFRQAVVGFAQKLSAEDRISLIQFDDRVLLLQDWTKSLVQLRRALNRLSPGMFTRFHDAMLLASRDQRPRTGARHAIIVLTDGIDSGRGSRFDVVARSALQSQTTIYVISNTAIERARKQAELNSLLSGPDSAVRVNELKISDLRLGLAALDASETKLDSLTKATGGRLYKPNSFEDLDETYAEVAEELRYQYALYYSPLNRKRDGQFRQVCVQTTDPGHQISARIGYYSPRQR